MSVSGYAKAICGSCNTYGNCRADPKVTKGNPWRCTATAQCAITTKLWDKR